MVALLICVILACWIILEGCVVLVDTGSVVLFWFIPVGWVTLVAWVPLVGYPSRLSWVGPSDTGILVNGVGLA